MRFLLTQRAAFVAAVIAFAIVLLWPDAAAAHGVARGDARFLQSLRGAAIAPLMYLGAKHMITGYDHLLFLVGVIFFLYRVTDVLLYVSLFTIGHSITLLAGVLGGILANPFIVDAIIGLSIVYKAFENMGGFQRLLRRQRRLAVTTAAVLPAEYGIDPIGTGKALGLTDLYRGAADDDVQGRFGGVHAAAVGRLRVQVSRRAGWRGAGRR